eukprot:CAMPEP_0204567098 /NCGR_PEP_ID=MMETSP0661-20131031/36409_1 /ASSEMBLY_ACC=CAM_ASM_000606 /TAXON_ID=109239 /ORGANISM="Alexandrium margalefi, Strain AMGDE01CS-322" /LENGTH=422 /DNA_ID=CAMNT_0051574987 /DNA_START=52 /DNA_END=1317 /DNA_ORIENTATION=-
MAASRKHYKTSVSPVYDVKGELNPTMDFAEPEMEPAFLGMGKLGHKVDAKHQKRITAYRAMDTPWGLSNMLAHEDPNLALRVFLLDNSGSTSQSDGHVLERYGSQYKAAPSTRWDEICAMAMAHAEWNARAGVRSEFLLLNPPCPQDLQEGRDFVVVDSSAGSAQKQVARLADVLRSNGPRGVTPISSRLQQLRGRLQREITGGRRLMLTIVTDGLPTADTCGTCTQRDQDRLVHELRTFTSTFNAFVVIRLATDEDSAIAYYNRIDEELELPLDILDDLQGEAQEVYRCGNGWLTYTPLIHRIREGGTLEKAFDLLDERALKLPEIAKMLEFLFQKPHDAAFPRNAQELYRVASEAVAQAPPVYDGRRDCMAPPVDLKRLKKALGLTTLQRVRSLPARMVRVMIARGIFRDHGDARSLGAA